MGVFWMPLEDEMALWLLGWVLGQGDGAVQEPSDTELIRGTVRKYAGQVKYCYEEELKSDPELEGRVEVQFTVEQGDVVQAELFGNTTGSAPLGDCVVEKAGNWKFPEQLNGELVYPFVLKPSVPLGVAAADPDAVDACFALDARAHSTSSIVWTARPPLATSTPNSGSARVDACLTQVSLLEPLVDGPARVRFSPSYGLAQSQLPIADPWPGASALEQRMAENREAFQACYQPGAVEYEGVVELSLAVDHGQVNQMEISANTTGDAVLEACILSRVPWVVFDGVPDGDHSFSFLFLPTEMDRWVVPKRKIKHCAEDSAGPTWAIVQGTAEGNRILQAPQSGSRRADTCLSAFLEDLPLRRSAILRVYLST